MLKIYSPEYLKRPIYDPRVSITALTSLSAVSPGIFSFEQQCDNWGKTLNITKIAQGSYATILRTQKKDDPNVYTIAKLIPLRRQKGKGSRRKDHTSIEDAAAEMKALSAMNLINGFVDFRSAHVLVGMLPPLLIDIQKQWEQTHPDDEADLDHDEDQLWLLVEMTDAGTDLGTLLEKGFPDGSFLHQKKDGRRLTVFQTWDIFWGVAEALALGERMARFEHRDLHPGNVCITQSANSNEPSTRTNPELIKRYTNLQVALIDYTLSRATLGGALDSEVLANSMKDTNLFEQYSESEIDERQYDTYRKMRDIVASQRSRRSRENRWNAFVPMTNLLWLQHLLVILLKQTAIPITLGPKFRAQAKKEARQIMELLEAIRDEFDPEKWEEWQYLSAEDLVLAQINGREALLQIRSHETPEVDWGITMAEAHERRRKA